MTDDKLHHSMRWTELLVIVAIISLLIAVLLPAIEQAREAARRTQSKNNLKQIGLALYNYESTYKIFPPGGVFDAGGKPYMGWMASITPYLDASNWFNLTNFNVPWDHPTQIEHFQCGYGPCYLNPSVPIHCGADGVIRTHYSASDLISYHNSSTTLADLTNGASETSPGP